MSGGVDSSVAAALLKENGYDVIGITMQLWPRHSQPNDSASGCCGHEAIKSARRVARRLGIPHFVMDFREVFARLVIDDFCREYSLGRTPNPCIRCNERIKFDLLREKARGIGADCLATGHHARIEIGTTGKPLLKKGKDAGKDQSYFLYMLTVEQMNHVLFPIGHLTKDEVRKTAAKRSLPVADRPESQEICFIPDNDHAAFIRERRPEASRPGPIIDRQGNSLGLHKGLAAYTVGQRHGLGIAAAEPLYVTAIKPEGNAVVVGSKEETRGDELVAGELIWSGIDRPERPFTAKARIRYRHPEADALITPMGNDECYVKFAGPQSAIAPGQAVVFYDGDTVLGGGTIIRQGK